LLKATQLAQPIARGLPQETGQGAPVSGGRNGEEAALLGRERHAHRAEFFVCSFHDELLVNFQFTI
jgi:hypothetical protein